MNLPQCLQSQLTMNALLDIVIKNTELEIFELNLSNNRELLYEFIDSLFALLFSLPRIKKIKINLTNCNI